MNEVWGYEREPYRTELDVVIVDAGCDDDRPFAVLNDSIFYPEGGGQPADRGRLGDVEVIDVQRHDGVLRHYLSKAVEIGDDKSLQLDWARRFDHMQQHSAQHLLTALAADRFGWQTTSFHLQPEVCDIELDVAGLSKEQLETLERQVVAEIRADRSILCRRVEPDALANLDVRSRGLPAGHRGSVRLVEISELDLNTCGGTHVRSTGELETLKLLGTESVRGGTRLFWVAGDRVRRRLAAHEARNDELRRLLGCSDDELISIAALKLDQIKEALRQQKHWLGQVADLTAERLIANPAAVQEAHFEPADASVLQQIARRFSQSEHAGLLFLTASRVEKHFFVVVGGGEYVGNLRSRGQRVAELLEGRGGGSGKIFQGKAQSLAQREQALADLKGSHS